MSVSGEELGRSGEDLQNSLESTSVSDEGISGVDLR